MKTHSLRELSVSVVNYWLHNYYLRVLRASVVNSF